MTKIKPYITYALLGLLTIPAINSLNARIVPPPTIEELCNAPLIIVATYAGYIRLSQEEFEKEKESFLKLGAILDDFPNSVDHYMPTKAKYTIKESLKHPKGLRIKDTIVIDYLFGMEEYRPTNWAFSPDLMTKKGTLWILFLNWDETGLSSYLGNFGRLEATKENIEKVKEVLKHL